jgi:uncharacterized protein (TIGR02246 family)
MQNESHLKLALCITAGLLIALPATKVGQAQSPSERRSPSLEDTSGARPEDAAAIREVLSSYAAALNASDTNAVMPLYVEDGVFMPCYSPSCVGTKAIRKAYEDVFKAITLHVKFDVVEVVVMNPEWAFARTNSAGTQTDHRDRWPGHIAACREWSTTATWRRASVRCSDCRGRFRRSRSRAPSQRELIPSRAAARGREGVRPSRLPGSGSPAEHYRW